MVQTCLLQIARPFVCRRLSCGRLLVTFFCFFYFLFCCCNVCPIPPPFPGFLASGVNGVVHGTLDHEGRRVRRGRASEGRSGAGTLLRRLGPHGAAHGLGAGGCC